jgi:hypothetical protein
MPHESPEDIRLAGAKLGARPHICAFFHSSEEEYQVLLPFIQDGFQRGDKAFHIVGPHLKADHLRRLQGIGIDPEEMERRKQLEIRVWDTSYLRSQGGVFMLEEMLALIREVLTVGRTDGFPLVRLVAHMEWALEDRPGVHDLIEYESRLNEILPEFHDPVICVYDLAKFGAGPVIDILRTHPMVIIGGILQYNPFYVPPEEFLKELRSRRASA